MSRKRQMIELSAPPVFREARPERFTATGFTCLDCHGNGWGWREDQGNPDAQDDERQLEQNEELKGDGEDGQVSDSGEK